jgi:hypothetical protein
MAEWRYRFTFIDLDTRWRCVLSFTSLSLYHRGKSRRYALDRRLRVPRVGLDVVERRKI